MQMFHKPSFWLVIEGKGCFVIQNPLYVVKGVLGEEDNCLNCDFL